ncbi:hypothetical protein [Streptomyces sp. NBC_01716]|uniref:hypothetical protein n=1 Tax=Streptomyces sp. NBC_01716 TaxID=2975917 RepID=UPI002E36C9DD|nr:hypothetical protein [Streptomyces sp. NBC_01716]
MSRRTPSPDPTPPGVNYGVINSGTMGPTQAAAFSHNATQHNHIHSPATEKAHESIQDLRTTLEQLRGQHQDAELALRILDEISPRLDAPENDAGFLRMMLTNLLDKCGGIPGVLASAQLVQSTVMALLPAA